MKNEIFKKRNVWNDSHFKPIKIGVVVFVVIITIGYFLWRYYGI